MYERGSNQWHDSYGSGASYNNGYGNGNGSANGAANGPGAEHVWYRSPSGEEPQHPTTQQPMSQQPSYQPAYTPPTYTPPAYEATTYEAAYPPATQSVPGIPAYPAPAGAPTPDVTVYDPATGLPMAGEPVVYPMRNVAGRMAMILGVVAILCTSLLFPLFPLAFLFGFGAIMLGRRGRLRARYGFASNPGSAGGGFALGIIAIVLAVIWTAAAAWLFTTYSATDLRDCIQDNTTAGAAISCIGSVVDAA